MEGRCGICGGSLTEDAVTFAAGGVVLFRPCKSCEDGVRNVARFGVDVGVKRLGATLEERAPDFMRSVKKAIKIARVVAEVEE